MHGLNVAERYGWAKWSVRTVLSGEGEDLIGSGEGLGEELGGVIKGQAKTVKGLDSCEMGMQLPSITTGQQVSGRYFLGHALNEKQTRVEPFNVVSLLVCQQQSYLWPHVLA